MAGMNEGKVTIHGIWGFDAADQEARREQKRCEDAACMWNVVVLPHGHYHVPSGGVYAIHPPEPRLPPAEALAAFQKAAAEGNVVIGHEEAPYRGGFIVQWSIEGYGFGELVVKMKGDAIEVDDECTSRETCERILAALVAGVPQYKAPIN